MTLAWTIGAPVPRREDAAILKGRGRFFAGLDHTGYLSMAVLRSPVAHGQIRKLDTAAARALPGVRLAIVAADLTANGPLPAIDLTPDSAPAGQPLLAGDRVLHVGQPVAVVVAVDDDAAREGVAAITLDIEPLPVLAAADAALQSATALHGGDNAAQTLVHLVGDPEAAFAAAHVVIEETFHFHRVGAMPLEPRGASASFDPATGRLRLAATTQIPGALRAAVSSLVGVDAATIDVERLQLGGGFGCKEAVYPEEILVAVAALRLGAPVRWRETRQEHMVSTVHGREGEARLRLALDASGIATALDVDGVSDIGAFFSFAGNLPGAAMGGMVRGPYLIPHFRARTRCVVTNKTPLNVYRGAGHPQAVFAMERTMDRAAAAFGLDRIEIRRRNLIPANAFPFDRGIAYHDAGRIVYDSGDYERCLDEALDAADANVFARRRAAYEVAFPTRRLGIGHAMVVELTSTGPDETILLSVSEDGRLVAEVGTVEIGQRTIGALTQILSDTTGIPPEEIEIRCGAPIGRSGGGTFASRGASVIGSALVDGATKLKAEALALYAELHQRSIDTLRWEGGGIVDAGLRNEPVRLRELVNRASAAISALSVSGLFQVPRSSFASACHIAIVSVDVETGVVTVVDYAVAHDCGRVIDPRGVDDQITGGVMQGLGATLFEHLPYSSEALPLTRTLFDYTPPVAADVPAFHLRHVETPSSLNPLGAKGAGEGGFSGAPASIVAAIEDALSEFGLRLTDDGPYTPSRVLGLIRKRATPKRQAGSP